MVYLILAPLMIVQVHICWVPVEIPFYDRDSLSPQELAQKELEDQIKDNLSLVYVTVQSDSELESSVRGMTYDPFVAAGLIGLGYPALLSRFPEGFPRAQREKDLAP